MKNFRVLVIALGISLLVACSATQIETAKKVGSVAMKVSKASLPLIAKIATAYGAPYAGVVDAFASALVPNYASVQPNGDCDDQSDDSYEESDESYEQSNDSYEESDESYEESDESYEQSDDDSTMGTMDDESYIDDVEQKSIGSNCNDNYSDSDGQGEYNDNEQYEQQSSSYEESEQQESSDDYQDDSQDVYGDEDVALLAQVDVLREVRDGSQFVSKRVRDGDTLSADDNYKVQIGCNIDCYAYVAQLDATGKMDPILPSSLIELENPLRANELYSIPSGDRWFFLDQNKGVETIYFIISKEPRNDIERIFSQLSSANDNLVATKSITVDEPLVLTKGIGGIRRGKRQSVQMPSGEEGNYVSTLLSSVDAELVMTRWFNHK